MSSSSSSSRLIWFRLVENFTGTATDSSTVQNFKMSSATSVSLNSENIIDQLRDAVKAKFRNKLNSVDAAELDVYRNQVSCE